MSLRVKEGDKIDKRAIGAAGAIIIVIIVAVVGFAGFRLYTERSALKGIESDVKGVGTPSVGLTSATFKFQMEYHNTSSYDSPPFNTTYDIYLAGSKIGEGSVEEISVPAGATETAEQTVSVDYADLGAAVVDTIKAENFTVTVKGKNTAKVLFGLIPVSQPFEVSYSVV